MKRNLKKNISTDTSTINIRPIKRLSKKKRSLRNLKLWSITGDKHL